MSQKHNGNTKRPKLKENQVGILKIYAFCQKIQQKALGPGESTAGVMYLSMGIHLKSYRIVPKKVATIYLVVQGRMQLEHSSHIVKVVVEATC